MRRRTGHLLIVTAISSLLVSAVTAQNATTVIKYLSKNTLLCDDALASNLITLFGRNRNIYEQCVAESQGYSLFPFSGYLPTDSEIVSMISSLACLEFFQAAISLPSMVECNLGGIDLLSALETLLMTSQDIVLDVAPLTASQLLDFITWRHARNLAKSNRQPYDATSASAVAFEEQVSAAATRLRVTLDSDLRILVDNRVVGSSSNATTQAEVAGEEDRSFEETTTTTGNGNSTASKANKGATTSTATRVSNEAVVIICLSAVALSSLIL